MNKEQVRQRQIRIKILLLQRGLTHEEIARRIGKSKAGVTKTLRGELTSKATQAAIAKVLGVRPEEIFDIQPDQKKSA